MCADSHRRIGASIAFLSCFVTASAFAAGAPGFATGIKIGEVDGDSARVWVRLTRDAQRVPMGAPMPVISYRHEKSGKTIQPKDRDPHAVPEVHLPDGITVQQLEGAAPGTDGEVRLRYRRDGAAPWMETAWQPVDPDRDYTTQFTLESLDAASKYQIEVDARAAAGELGGPFAGAFRTAPVNGSVAPV